ncbi:xylanase [Microbacterium immunditiarum]|uniref:Xylanase n=1 Tax=Microbacterium immunditiarum TaxID=337480 RepID=A0A7Y9GN99_9MICO|nr:hypothetical protein [Microbacterium immunditiarum]
MAVIGVIVGLAGAMAALGSGSSSSPQTPAPIGPSATPTAGDEPPAETPPTLVQALLAATDDPAACVVSFEGEEVDLPPILQSEGSLFDRLPIPQREGLVFAGWYATLADAAAYAVPARMNGSREVACTERQLTLYGAWTTPEANAAENARIPIMMYHQFTAKPEGESGWTRGNHVYIGDFEAHMAYIAQDGFYFPTWDELSAFIDGRLFLPNHSLIVTDDAADQTWFDLAVPIVDKYKVLTTSFMITAHRQDPPPSKYVLRRSHTHDMHQPGANGDGQMVNWAAADIAADLEASAAVLGAKEVVAYPFGHYNETAKQGVRQAGFELARTIEQGYVRIGSDKLALPCVRISYGMGADALPGLIG